MKVKLLAFKAKEFLDSWTSKEDELETDTRIFISTRRENQRAGDKSTQDKSKSDFFPPIMFSVDSLKEEKS